MFLLAVAGSGSRDYGFAVRDTGDSIGWLLSEDTCWRGRWDSSDGSEGRIVYCLGVASDCRRVAWSQEKRTSLVLSCWRRACFFPGSVRFFGARHPQITRY